SKSSLSVKHTNATVDFVTEDIESMILLGIIIVIGGLGIPARVYFSLSSVVGPSLWSIVATIVTLGAAVVVMFVLKKRGS
ncbi:MAG: hypothetical protein ABEI77_09485, partial [Halorientalis sp.]